MKTKKQIIKMRTNLDMVLEVKDLLDEYLISGDDEIRVEIMMMYLEHDACFSGSTLRFISGLITQDPNEMNILLGFQAFLNSWNLDLNREITRIENFYIDLMKSDENLTDIDIYLKYREEFCVSTKVDE